MGQAGPDGSPLARKALDWLLEMAHEHGTDLAWTGRPDDDELDPTLSSRRPAPASHPPPPAWPG
jgi:hypothetical protein